jgi:hypothetical protein
VFVKGDFVALECVGAEVDWLGARKHEVTLVGRDAQVYVLSE